MFSSVADFQASFRLLLSFLFVVYCTELQGIILSSKGYELVLKEFIVTKEFEK